MILWPFLALTLSFAQTTGGDAPNESAEGRTEAKIEDIDVAVGLDRSIFLDFTYARILNSNPGALKIAAQIREKREIVVRGVKAGQSLITIRDQVGNARARFRVRVTTNSQTKIVSELRALIGDIEGLEIGIKGGRVYVGGQIVVPNDIGRITTVLNSGYKDVLPLYEMSPQTQRVIAQKMQEEIARNGMRDVSVRVVNGKYWIEGVVTGKDQKQFAVDIAKNLLPPKIASLASTSGRFQTIQADDPLVDYIIVNPRRPTVAQRRRQQEKKTPKMVKVTVQFVELSKNYNKIFSFQWAPLLGADSSSLTIGQRSDGSVSSTTGGQGGGRGLTAVISNLLPKLASAKDAGFARVVNSGMGVTLNEKPININKSTQGTYAVGTGQFSQRQGYNLTFNFSVTPRILPQEKVEMAINSTVTLPAGTGPQGNPLTNNNTISATVIVKSKETAVIGGVVSKTLSSSFDKDTPDGGGGNNNQGSFLFNFVRSKTYATSSAQSVVFVTPEIIESASEGTEQIRRKFRRRR